MWGCIICAFLFGFDYRFDTRFNNSYYKIIDPSIKKKKKAHRKICALSNKIGIFEMSKSMTLKVKMN